MNKYRVTKYYVNSLDGVFEANNKEEAEKMFDDTPEHDLNNEYSGELSSWEDLSSTVEEL